jgi:hypothetical protein
MERTLDFIIDEKECNLASFDNYLNEHLNILSIILQSILFYNSWNIIDFWDPEIALLTFALNKTIKTEHKIEYEEDLSKPPQFCLPHNPTRTRGTDTINGIELNCDGTELAKHSIS